MVYTDLRKGRYSAPGQEYLVTAVTMDRIRVFDDFDCARLLVRVLRHTEADGMADWLAWVIMPDHFHALLRLRSGTRLASLLHTVKGSSARAINRRLGRVGTLWQPNFHDRALRADENRVVVARYIVANPLRSGLVDRIGDFPHWDCAWL